MKRPLPAPAAPIPFVKLAAPAALCSAVALGVGVLWGRTMRAAGGPSPAPTGHPPGGALPSEGVWVERAGLAPAPDPKARHIDLKSLAPSSAWRKGALPKAVQAYRTVDELLASCPTDLEMRTIRDDFNIYFDEAVFEEERARGGSGLRKDGTWVCTPGGDESSVMLGVYNLFRVAKFLTFDAPLPLLDAVNVYDWVREQGFAYHIFSGTRTGIHGSYGLPGSRTLHLNDDMFYPAYYRRGFDPSAGMGGYSAAGILVHEGWHVANGRTIPHDRLNDCSPARNDSNETVGGMDSSLEYGGAWAASYWWARWMAEHTGTKLSAVQRADAAQLADYVLTQRICGR